MNKIHQVVWSAHRQCYVVAPEKSKRQGKSSQAAVIGGSMLAGAFLLAAPYASAADCTQGYLNASKSMSPYLVTADCDGSFDDLVLTAGDEVKTSMLVVGKENVSGLFKPIYGLKDLTVNLDYDQRSQYTLSDGYYQATTAILENAANASTVNIKGVGQSKNQSLAIKHEAGGNAVALFNHGHDAALNIDGLDYSVVASGSDAYLYGVMAGSGSSGGFGSGVTGSEDGNSHKATVTIGNAERLANQQTVLSVNMKDKGKGKINLVNGIRVIQYNEGGFKGAYGEVNVLGNTEMDLTGRQTVGIYLSSLNAGSQAAVNLYGDTDITLHEAKHYNTGKYSAGILLGKGNRGVGGNGDGESQVTSAGHLTIDALDTIDVAPILVDGSDSRLAAASANAKNTFKANQHFIDILNAKARVNLELRDADFITGTEAGNGHDVADSALVNVGSRVTDSGLTLVGAGTNIRAREQGNLITVGDSSQFTLNVAEGAGITGLTEQSATTGKEGSLNINLSDVGSRWTLAKKGNETITKFNDLVINNGARLEAAQLKNEASAFTLKGDVSNFNGGVISLVNGSGYGGDHYADVLTIDGDYTGKGGVIEMNTLWDAPGNANGANSKSDKLVITGNTLGDGETTIKVVGKDGHSAIIDGSIKQVESALNSIEVVSTGGTYDGAFVGTVSTNGGEEAQLMRDGDGFRWSLSAANPQPPEKPEEPGKPEQPEKPNHLRPSVPGYTLMAHANMELGYTTLGSLHERVGENQTLAWDNCGSCGKSTEAQTWTRVLGKHLEATGKERLSHEGEQYVMQVGHDFSVAFNETDGSRRHTGLMASYGRSELDFFDKYRAVNNLYVSDKKMGKGTTDAATLGGYSTYYTKNGSYLDLVGQVSYLRNRYEARNNHKVSQNGWSAAVSAEVGRPYLINNSQWQIEPQAQLMYQYLSLDSFDDAGVSVNPEDSHGVRGRLGVRLANNGSTAQYKTNTFYTVANVWHDFTKPKGVDVGQRHYKEDFNQTWGEVGLGMQVPTSKTSYLYADARYEHSFGDSKREGYRGSVGFKQTW